VGTSATVTVTVTGGSGCTAPQYVENGGYVAGSRVKNAGNQYECKPYPFTGWCNGAAWAYAPGSGAYWQDAWTLVGSCSGRLAQYNQEEGVAEETEISVAPNPGASGRPHVITVSFNKDAGDVRVQLINLNGTTILQSEHKQVKRLVQVQAPALTSGLYILRVQSANRMLTTKYIVD
jgi:hypothetical protein